MEVNFTTPFNHTERLLAQIKEYPFLLRTREGFRWLRNSLSHLRRTVILELKVLKRGSSFHLAEYVLPPCDKRPLPFWLYPSVALFRFKAHITLLILKKLERVHEDIRQFHLWGEELLNLQGQVEKTSAKDFRQLTEILEGVKLSLVESRTPCLTFTATSLASLFKPLPEGTWKIPIFRSLWFPFPTERIVAGRIIDLVSRTLGENHRREIDHLLKSIKESLQRNLQYLDALHAYLIADSDEGHPNGIHHQRSEKLIEHFYIGAIDQVKQSQERVENHLAAVFDTIAKLYEVPWYKVHRAIVLHELREKAYRIGATKDHIRSMTTKGEARCFQFINERLKPAMGISPKVIISSKISSVDHRWTEDPKVPEQLADVILDRKNPSLLIIPPQILDAFTSLEEYYQRHGMGNFLLQTDHLAGGFGMLGYLLPLRFPDAKYRIFRHTLTRPLSKLPDFNESVIFLDNFERMVLIDEEHISFASDLLEQIMDSSKLWVIAVNQIAAEYIRAAVPAFSRFLFEINLSKYEFSYFRRIIEKRMVISGFQFEYRDDALFWSKLYQISSGIPGVGLRIFLRCVSQIDKDRIKLSYDLPDPREHFHSLSLKELIILRKIYMHPYLEIEAINPADIQKARVAVHALYTLGLLVSSGHHFAIRPEFCGALRDYLMQTNLA